MLIIFYVSFSIISLVMLYFINKKFMKSNNFSKNIVKYKNIAELKGDELAHAKANLSKLGVDGNATKETYLQEARVYGDITILLVTAATLLGLYVLFSENSKSTGIILISVSLILISAKFYELYGISKINIHLSSDN